MIFVTLGSQKFQFNRLLIKVDELIENGAIKDDVFAQIGASDYRPKHYPNETFLNRNKFEEMMDQCSLVLTHGGTGTIVEAIKKGKKVIAVPRLAKYGEHVDDHQLQLIEQFEKAKLICACYDCEQLGDAFLCLTDMACPVYRSNTVKWIDELEAYIDSI